MINVRKYYERNIDLKETFSNDIITLKKEKHSYTKLIWLQVHDPNNSISNTQILERCFLPGNKRIYFLYRN